jgi:UDP-GlcNAc:undecaprenyl-phosphate GlcNAc-1-phosphate transferase
MQATEAALLFVIAGLWGLLGTRIARALALRLGFVNHPNPIIPQHTRRVAYLGGLGVLIGIAGGLLFFCSLAAPACKMGSRWPITIPAALFLALGVLDDRLRLSAKGKLALQLACAVVAVGVGLTRPFTGIALLDAVLSCLWIVLLVNAFNLTDVCDGLVAGLSVITFLFLAWLEPSVAVLAVAAAGACAGFLWLNFPPATIFLGDAGSHLLGFLAAALTLSMAPSLPAWPYVPVILLIMGVPLFELVFLTFVRLRKGLAWWRGSPDHFSLRLQAAGLSRLQTDLVAWTACAVLCAAAAAVQASAHWLQAAILAVELAALAICWRWLLNWEVRRERPGAKEASPSHRPAE